MLKVPHVDRSTYNIVCVRQLLILVLDRCLWLGKGIPIDEMLIRRIVGLHYQGMDLTKEFVRKNQDKVAAQTMKDKYTLIKKLQD